MSEKKIPYKTLFNHDGWCVFSNNSRYQDINRPVGLSQVYGYIDEVADANCDVLMLCPNMYQLPGWDSDHYPFWREEYKSRNFNDGTAAGKTLDRFSEFILQGNDFIQLSLDRTRKRGLGFFLSWRMNECHGVRDEDHPSHSRFWREHPEWRINGGAKKGSIERQALCFSHVQVRDYQFGFIEELCDRYSIDGLELDFLRFPYFFPPEVAFEEKSEIITEFLRRIKKMLIEKKKDIPLCVRIFDDPELVRQMGFDLDTCLQEGLIDMVNLSHFYVTQPDGATEIFRERYPHVTIYSEITQCMQLGRRLELSVEQCRKTTKEMFYALAQSYLERGSDGLSFFNLTYTRDYSFSLQQKMDRVEPDFQALHNLTDLEFLKKQEKHYFIVESENPEEGWPSARQLPKKVDSTEKVELCIHVGDDPAKNIFSSCVLRIMSHEPCDDNTVDAFFCETKLNKVAYEGELFPCPYREGIPSDDSFYMDYSVPLHLLEKGWNTFSFLSEDNEPVRITRMELALYH